MNLLPVGKVLSSERLTAINKTAGRGNMQLKTFLMEGLCRQTQLLAMAVTGGRVARRSGFSSTKILGTHSSLALGPHDPQAQAWSSSQFSGRDDM